jgi:ankyrin repeat protein
MLSNINRNLGTIISFFFVFTLSSSVLAEDIFFKLDNQKIYSIDDNTLAAHVDENGELATKLQRMGTLGIGTGTEEDPIYIGVSGQYFGKYVLTLLKMGKVEFPSLADARNALDICQQLGLPRAEEYIKNYIQSQSLSDFTNQGFNAFSWLLIQKGPDEALVDVASLVLSSVRANDTQTLRHIYEAKLIDVNFRIPTDNSGPVVTQLLDGSIGTTALGYAVTAGNLEVVQLLLSFGANPTMRTVRPDSDRDGMSILERADETGNRKIKRIIKKAIKDLHRKKEKDRSCSLQ